MAKKATMIDVFLEGEGIPDMVLLELDETANVNQLLDAARTKGADIDEDTKVFVGASSEPVEKGMDLKAADIINRARVHIHRCHRIKVEIRYQSEIREEEFPPSATISTIKQWAIEQFPIDAAMKVNMILRLCDSATEPSSERQIGSLVQSKECDVCFDFVVDPRFQGDQD